MGLSILWVIIVIGSVLYYFSPYISIGFQLKLVVVVVVDQRVFKSLWIFFFFFGIA